MWSFGWGWNFQKVWQCFHRCMFIGRPKSCPQQCPIEARMRSTLPSWSDMFRCELEEAEPLWDVFLQSKHVRTRAKLLVSQSRWIFELDNILSFKFNRDICPNLRTIKFSYSVSLSDTAMNQAHNLSSPRREPIPLGHSDGHFIQITISPASSRCTIMFKVQATECSFQYLS